MSSGIAITNSTVAPPRSPPRRTVRQRARSSTATPPQARRTGRCFLVRVVMAYRLTEIDAVGLGDQLRGDDPDHRDRSSSQERDDDDRLGGSAGVTGVPQRPPPVTNLGQNKVDEQHVVPPYLESR